MNFLSILGERGGGGALMHVYVYANSTLALLDEGTSRAGDLKSGSYYIKATACVWMYTCYVSIKTQYSYYKFIYNKYITSL